MIRKKKKKEKNGEREREQASTICKLDDSNAHGYFHQKILIIKVLKKHLLKSLNQCLKTYEQAKPSQNQRVKEMLV